MSKKINPYRLEQLTALGMTFNGDSYIGKTELNMDFNVHHNEIIGDTDTIWSEKMNKLDNELIIRKAKKLKQ